MKEIDPGSSECSLEKIGLLNPYSPDEAAFC